MRIECALVIWLKSSVRYVRKHVQNINGNFSDLSEYIYIYIYRCNRIRCLQDCGTEGRMGIA
jgi:hypothetical protein